MEALALWFAGIVAASPYGVMILTLIGTIVVIATIVMPTIVKIIPGERDNKIWAAIEGNILFKIIKAVVSKFSVYQPKK